MGVMILDYLGRFSVISRFLMRQEGESKKDKMWDLKMENGV